MIINDSKCKCGGCMQDGYCTMQRTLGYLQSVAYAIDFPVVLDIHVEECQKFEAKPK